MDGKMNALIELERRGELPEQFVGVKAELRNRGEIPEAQPQTSTLGALANSAANMLSFGLGDRIDALGGVIQGRAPGEGQFSVGNFDQPFRERFSALLAEEQADTAQRRTDHPIASIAGDVAGSILPGAAALNGLQRVAGVATNAASRAGQAGLVGGGLGAIAGGGGAPEGQVLQGAAIGGGLGAVGGAGLSAAFEGVARGAAPIVQAISNRGAPAQAAQLGIGDDAATVVRDVLSFDDPNAVAARIQVNGPDAMIADAGVAPAGLLDAALQQPGQAQTIAREAIEQRATRASDELTQGLDNALGVPRGIQEIGRDISLVSAPARQEAYDAAYAAPINYASAEGRKIESVLERVPSRILDSAVRTANELMQIDQVGARQILAEVGEGGKVKISELPNVVQLDYLKRALNELGSETDVLGRTTAQARPFRKLAGMVREAVTDAVPEYRQALSVAADKIEADEAAQLGINLFERGTTREVVNSTVAEMSPASRDILRQSVRSQIDETLANVRTTLTDPNLDAREALTALRFMTTRAGTEKLDAVLEPGAAADGLRQSLSRATAAMELRAAVATNSKTATRLATREAVDQITEPGAVGSVLRGQPLNAASRAIQEVTDTTAQSDAARVSAIYSDLARILTEPRGPEAVRVFRALTDLSQQGVISANRATRVRRLLREGGVRLGASAGAGAPTATGLISSP